MQFVKISKTELAKIGKLHKALMAYASYGLFFREGLAVGEEVVAAALDSGEDYYTVVNKILRYRGWITDVEFQEGRVLVEGSIETYPGSELETCHRLRGILQKVLEARFKRKVECTEVECQSLGADRCMFTYEFKEEGEGEC